MLPHAPGVQMQAIPEDAIPDDTVDEDTEDPDKRLSSKTAVQSPSLSQTVRILLKLLLLSKQTVQKLGPVTITQ